MLFILLACALLLLLFFQLAKSPPACGPPGSGPSDITRKKGPQKAAKFKLIKALKQRKRPAVRRGFDVRRIRPAAARTGGTPELFRFSAVKREIDAIPGYVLVGRIYNMN